MKVTAIIPDELVKEVRQFSKAKNTTESLILALSDWVSHKKILALNEKVKKVPLSFKKSFDSSKNRQRNRSR